MVKSNINVLLDIRPLSAEMLGTGQLFTITTCYLNFYISSIIGQFAAIFSYLVSEGLENL